MRIVRSPHNADRYDPIAIQLHTAGDGRRRPHRQRTSCSPLDAERLESESLVDPNNWTESDLMDSQQPLVDRIGLSADWIQAMEDMSADVVFLERIQRTLHNRLRHEQKHDLADHQQPDTELAVVHHLHSSPNLHGYMTEDLHRTADRDRTLNVVPAR